MRVYRACAANTGIYLVCRHEVLFSKSHRQRPGKQLREMRIRAGSEKLALNKEATRWLGNWLNSRPKFASHINERVRRARNAEIRIQGLTQMHGPVPGLVLRIYQQLHNRQPRVVQNFGGNAKKHREQTI